MNLSVDDKNALVQARLSSRTRALFAASQQPVAIVLGLSTATGLSIVRCLGECGVPVVGINQEPYGMGSYSRFCKAVENAQTKEDLLSLLLLIARGSSQKPVILCESDMYIRFIDQYREQLCEVFHLVGSARIPLRQLMEKSVMLECARQAGLPVPLTITTKSNTINARDAAAMHYPCFIKPLFSQAGERTKGEYAESPDQLIKSIQNTRFCSGALIQEVIPGPETNIFGYCGFRGEKVCWGVIRKKIRQIPKDFGVATVAVTAPNRNVEELAKKLLESVDFHGMFGVEFKQDERDKTFKFVEINMRTLGTNELYRGVGLNIPYVAYCDAIGRPCYPRIVAEKKITWISEIDDLITLLKYDSCHAMQCFRVWIKTLLVAQRFAVFSWSDPLPFFVKVFSHLTGASKNLREQHEPIC